MLLLCLGGSSRAELLDWGIGPFQRPPAAQPIITPNPASVFDDPVGKETVHWEASHTFNPAAIVKDGKICVLYRAEYNSGKNIGGYTSRLGLAVSADGFHFQRMPAPVLYPAEDDQEAREWEGGCEDPRIEELEDGSYLLFYTQYKRINGKRGVGLGLATSTDLTYWTKLGPVVAHGAGGNEFTPSKSASLVTAVHGGRLIAQKIQGKYWLYVGEGSISVLSSPNLRDWTAESGVLLGGRKGLFDSGFPECGPPAVVTARGIVLLYNGKNGEPGHNDPDLKPGVYSAGEALFNANAPTKLLARASQPFFKPEMPWEATGQYAAGTTFIEGLVLFQNRWFLYYGCADTFVGVASADFHPADFSLPPP